MSHNPFSLKGKTIFVTGASSGIGRAISIECSKMGAHIVLSGRNKNRLNETFDMLEGEGHLQIIADLENPVEIQDLVKEVPLINGVVYSAGFTKTVPFQFISENDLLKIMQVNFVAPTIISKALLKNKNFLKDASIVFISSISGVFCSSVGGGMYSASKGAVNGIVKSMAIELAVKNIRVNSICPGMINTNIFDSGIITEDQLSYDIKRYPMKRFGEPEEVAYAAIYLLSDASRWVTGSNLLIDGGYTLL